MIPWSGVTCRQEIRSMQGCKMNSNRLAAPVIFEDSSGCYPVCIKNPYIMDNITASTTRKCLFTIRV
ncbi:hypothetical protein G3042_004442 [Escherichia coli]|nr:hypothetical protein [Escherichia coli]